MSEVPLRRFTLLLVLVVTCVMGSCTGFDDHLVPANSCGRGQGNSDRNAPVVCVDGTGELKANPDSVRVWNVSSVDRKTRPVIHWVTNPPRQKLTIEFKQEGCVEKPKCNKEGHCSAHVLESIGTGQAEGTEIKRCQYKILFNDRVLDPDTVVVECCSG